MNYSISLTKEVEALAEKLGARHDAVKKWRLRGIPPKWQLKLLEAQGGKSQMGAAE